jgi:hypothetical protein
MISVTAEQGNAGAAFASRYTNPRERQHTGALDLNPIVEDANLSSAAML